MDPLLSSIYSQAQAFPALAAAARASNAIASGQLSASFPNSLASALSGATQSQASASHAAAVNSGSQSTPLDSQLLLNTSGDHHHESRSSTDNETLTPTHASSPGRVRPKGKKKPPQRDAQSHRQIEKRRRDRMNTNLTNLSEIIPRSFIEKSHSVQTRGRIEKTEIIETAIKYLKHVHDICGPLLVDSGIIGVQDIDPTGSLMNRRSNSQASSVSGQQPPQQQHHDPLFAFVSSQSKEMAASLMRDRMSHYKLGFQESISRVLAIVSDTLQLDHNIMAILHARLEMNKDEIGIEVISRKMMKNMSSASNGVGGGNASNGLGAGSQNGTFDVQHLRNQYLAHDVSLSLDLEQSRSPSLRTSTGSNTSGAVNSSGSSLNALEMISKSFGAAASCTKSSSIDSAKDSGRVSQNSTLPPTTAIVNKTPSTGGEVYKFKKHIKDRFQNGHQSDVDSGIAMGVSNFGSSHSESLSSAVPSPVDNDEGSPSARTLSNSSSSNGAAPSLSPPILVNSATSPHASLSPAPPPAAIAAATPGDDLGSVPILLQNMISNFCANGYGGTGLVPVFALHPSGRHYVLMGISPEILSLEDLPSKPLDPNRRIMFPMNVVIDFNHDKRITTESLLDRLRAVELAPLSVDSDLKPLLGKRKPELPSVPEMKRVKCPQTKSQTMKPFPEFSPVLNRPLSDVKPLLHQQPPSSAPPSAHSSAFTVPNLSQFRSGPLGANTGNLFGQQAFGMPLNWPPYPPTPTSCSSGPQSLASRVPSPNGSTNGSMPPHNGSTPNSMLNENFLNAAAAANFYPPSFAMSPYLAANYLSLFGATPHSGGGENGTHFSNSSPVSHADFDSLNNNSSNPVTNGAVNNNPLNLSNKIKTEH